MSKLAYFDQNTLRVLQWIDTDTMHYNLPDSLMLHTCTQAEWELRHAGEMMVSEGAIVPYIPLPKTEDELFREIQTKVAEHLDAAARTKNYDNIQSAALRSAYAGPFHEEGIAFATWMDGCWHRCYELLAEVKSGERQVMTCTEVISELPTLVLP